MTPWYRGFAGTVVPINEKGRNYVARNKTSLAQGARAYDVRGLIHRTAPDTVEITELPVGLWTENYKKFLLRLFNEGRIYDFSEYHTETQVHFVVTVPPATLDQLYGEGHHDDDGAGAGAGVGAGVGEGAPQPPLAPAALHRFFRLNKVVRVDNLHCWDEGYGRIVRYDDELDLIQAFFANRLRLYELRKAHLEREAEAEARALANMIQFVDMVVDGSLVIGGRPQKDVVADAKAAGLHSLRRLLGLKLGSLTKEKVAALRKEHDKVIAHLEQLRATAATDLWRAELASLREAWGKDARYEDRRVAG